MQRTTKAEEVSERLDELVAELAGGSHHRLGEQAAILAGYAPALEELLEAVRQGRVRAEAAELSAEIRAKITLVRDMLDHARKVSTGLAGILALLYEDSQYSARGAPTWNQTPRIKEQA